MFGKVAADRNRADRLVDGARHAARGACRPYRGLCAPRRKAREGTALGFADTVARHACARVRDADLVVLATPVGAFGDACQRDDGQLKPGAILSDVGSVKMAVIRDVGHSFLTAFISSRPILSQAPSNRAPKRASPNCSTAAGDPHAAGGRRPASVDTLKRSGSAGQPGRDHGCETSRSGARDHQPCAASDCLQHRGHGGRS